MHIRPSSEGWWRHPESDDAAGWQAWANALPLCHDLGLRCTSMALDGAVFEMRRSTLTANPNGAVNGGVVAAAADQVMGALTLRMSDPGLLPATASFHIQFHSPALPKLTLIASALGGGRRTRFIEVVIEDRDGNRCATSQGTMIAGGSRER